MIKKTLYFGNACLLKKKDMQLVVESDINDSATIPIEDIGVVILDNPQIVITQALVSSLMDHNSAILISDQKHLPYGLALPMFSHHAFYGKTISAT